MNVRNLIRRKAETAPAVRYHDPFEALVRDFFSPFSLLPRDFAFIGGDFTPRVDVTETDKEVRVTAELPGVDEKDIALELDENALILSGEKKEEHEEKSRTGYRLERAYGSFRRVIPLPSRVDVEKVHAEFKRGVLSVKLPKLEESSRKRIEIKAE
jgi:HSP20 family protein